jgi:hypothetical protein
MNIDHAKRTWNTSVRAPWNVRIFHIIKAIDAHNDLYFKTLDRWHLDQAQYLRSYLQQLKDWIIEEEETR